MAATYPCDSVGKVPDATFGKARASQERGGDVLVVVQRVAQHLGLRDKREARILRVSEILAKRASIGGRVAGAPTSSSVIGLLARWRFVQPAGIPRPSLRSLRKHHFSTAIGAASWWTTACAISANATTIAIPCSTAPPQLKESKHPLQLCVACLSYSCMKKCVGSFIFADGYPDC